MTAVQLVDAYLFGLDGRQLVSAAEVWDLLLDVRNYLTKDQEVRIPDVQR